MNNLSEGWNKFNLRNAMPTAGYAYAHILKKTGVAEKKLSIVLRKSVAFLMHPDALPL
ncbi:hypothetical protein [Nostoc sp.]|uniref:hypothetical protein n=1 Tax=Nostoc sp. TaxID=1180 RepID=UPI002FF592BE